MTGFGSKPAVPSNAFTGSLTEGHLARVRGFYESPASDSRHMGRFYRKLLAQYYRYAIPPDASILEVGCGSGELLELLPNRDVTGIDLAARQIERAKLRVPHGTFITSAAEFMAPEGALDRTFDYIVISDSVSLYADVQSVFERLRAFARPDTRLIVNFYNTDWYPVLQAATSLRLKSRQPETNWLSASDMRTLLNLSGWEMIQQKTRVIFPLEIPIVERLINRFVAPLMSFICLTIFQTARLEPQQVQPQPTVSVVVPARNEAGNIEAAVRRIPEMGAGTEIIFIEGNSTDNTWDRILEVTSVHTDRRIRTLRQSGKGKGNAVREAFDAATGDILMILDADLTTAPEELPKFYEALASGRAEFCNGVRLVYPMEGKAMRFLNMCANKFFSIAFSWILGQPVKDTLCGTKVLFRRDYQRIAANRAFFGDFDPFGDFDLLFGAAKLNLKIADIPIRYRDRTYGETNIQRWSHGWLLLKMVVFAGSRIKFI